MDEGPQDRSFNLFRARLRRAAKRHDTRFVLRSLHPRVVSSFGGDVGVKDFQRFWNIDRPDSRLWRTLATILSLGGSFRTYDGHRQFCAPYVYSRWPDEWDAFQYAAILGRNINVRTRPSLASPVVTRLSYDLVRIPRGIRGVWVPVITPSGRRGYVYSRFIRSPIDYRACFEKLRGKWLMTALVAGD
ncbi:MAG: SH3 domain-containing protein [Armatimonadetes bacterium]|nr:SH3 domain-containing protein [Armatimonadota bacterium]